MLCQRTLKSHLFDIYNFAITNDVNKTRSTKRNNFYSTIFFQYSRSDQACLISKQQRWDSDGPKPSHVPLSRDTDGTGGFGDV